MQRDIRSHVTSHQEKIILCEKDKKYFITNSKMIQKIH